MFAILTLGIDLFRSSCEVSFVTLLQLGVLKLIKRRPLTIHYNKNNTACENRQTTFRNRKTTASNVTCIFCLGRRNTVVLESSKTNVFRLPKQNMHMCWTINVELFFFLNYFFQSEGKNAIIYNDQFKIQKVLKTDNNPIFFFFFLSYL